jgi:hypothetical protein
MRLVTCNTRKCCVSASLWALCLGNFRARLDLVASEAMLKGCRWARMMLRRLPVVATAVHDAKPMKTAAIDDLSYLTYFPLPLSISW